MQHQFQRITFQDVEVVTNHPSGPAVVPTGDEETRIGCKACNMGIEEALTIACPGISLAEMMEGIDFSLEDPSA